MPFIYSNVSRDGVVLAERLDLPFDNVPVIARQIIAKLPATGNQKKTYALENKFFHYMCDEGIITMCVVDDQVPHRIAYAFLQDIKERFKASFGNTNWASAPELFYDEQFSRVLHERMEYFAQDPGADKFRRVKGEIDQVKSVMIQNIDKVLERGGQIEELVQKTAVLDVQSVKFKKQSTALKNKLWWKNARLWVVIGVLLALVAGGVVVGILYKVGVIHF